MCIYQRMQTIFDPNDTPPPLSPEWLSPERTSTVPRMSGGRKLAQDLSTRDSRDDQYFKTPKIPEIIPVRSPPPAPPNAPSLQTPVLRQPNGLQQTREPQQTRETKGTREQALESPSSPRERLYEQTNVRQSQRNRTQPDRLQPTLKGKTHEYLRPTPTSMFATAMLASTMFSPQSSHMLHHQATGFDPIGGYQEDIHPWTTQTPWAFKAKASKDPDLPSIREALTGPHADSFWEAMEKEISTLEAMELVLQGGSLFAWFLFKFYRTLALGS